MASCIVDFASAEFSDKLYGCGLGKNAGVTLGDALEEERAFQYQPVPRTG